jgi:hydroxypyruvate reductase
LERYGIEQVVGTAVYPRIQSALAKSPITRLTNYQSPITNLIIGDVRLAAEAARQSAENSGFISTILTAHLEGEAREMGKFATALAKELPPGHCTILGGETVVTLRGNGFGGRNLELALSAAIALDGWENVAVASFASDGDDGPTGAAGAVVTGETVGYGRALHLDAHQFLNNNDSYTYFQKLDAAGYSPHLLITGPTGTNVNDLIFIIRNS